MRHLGPLCGCLPIIHHNIDAALEATGVTHDGDTLNPRDKAAAYSAFEQSKQRFFGHLLASMKCPTLIRSIGADLDAGRARVVQLVPTGEALLDRRLADERERVVAGPATARTLYPGLDGTGVPACRAETEGRTGKRPDGSVKTREAKLVALWSAERIGDDGQRVAVSQVTIMPS